MSVEAPTVATDSPILLCSSRTPELISAQGLAQLLNDIVEVYESCAYFALLAAPESWPDSTVLLGDIRVVTMADREQLQNYTPPLLVQQLRIGSIWLEFVQAAGGPAGIGAALWMTMRAIEKGPGQMHKWGGLLPRLRADYYEAKVDATEAKVRAQRLKVRLREENDVISGGFEAVARINAEQPDLSLDVVDEERRPIDPPNSLFLD